MKYHFDVTVSVEQQTGEVLAAYFRLRKGRVARTREYESGVLYADFNAKGELLGVEMLAPCKIASLNRIALKEPEGAEFIRRSMPTELTPA